MYRRMTLIGVLTVVASMLVFGIANALPASTSNARTAVTSISDTSNPATSTPDTSTVTPSSPDTSVVDAPVVGPTTYVVGEAGSVTVNFDGSSLNLVSADANDPWTAFGEQTSGREIEVEFSNGNREIKFNAELEDGGIRIRVRDRLSDATTTDTTISSNTTDTTRVTSTTIDDHDDSSNRGSDDDDHDDDHDDESSNRGSDDDDDDDADHDEDDDHGGDDGDDD